MYSERKQNSILAIQCKILHVYYWEERELRLFRSKQTPVNLPLFYMAIWSFFTLFSYLQVCQLWPALWTDTFVFISYFLHREWGYEMLGICLSFCLALWARFLKKVVDGFFGATICKTVRPMLLDHCLSCPVHLSCLWRWCIVTNQMLGWIEMKLGTQVDLGLSQTVLDGDPAPPSPKGHSLPQFSAHICCGKMAGWIKMPFGREVSLGPSDIVLDANPAPLPEKGDRAPQFSAHVYCGQTAGCIRISFATEVGLGPGDIVRWGRSSPRKGHSLQCLAHVYCNQTAGWIKMPLGTKVGLSPCHIVLDGDPTPSKKSGRPIYFCYNLVNCW